MNKELYIEENVRGICEKYTKLTVQEIDFLKKKTHQLSLDKQYEENDVFVDVRNAFSGEAIVVSHRKPRNRPSLYKEPVVGKAAFRKDEPGPLRTLETSQTSVELHARTQEGILIKQTSHPVIYKNKTIAVLIIEEELNNETQPHFKFNDWEQSVEEAGSLIEKFGFLEQSLTKYIDDAILIFDNEGILRHHNKSADYYYREFGYRNSINGLHYNNLALDFMTFEQILQLVQEGDYDSLKAREISFGNCHFKSKIIVLTSKGVVIQTFEDITEQKLRESQVREELVAIQEIHHRVKNNLQTVVSLLRLQAGRAESPEAKKVLNESVNRVFSIAATHELLSQQKEDDVQLKMVLDTVITNLSRFYSESMDVCLGINIDPSIILNSNTAVTIALIMNELLQNCYDHAFTEKGNGTSSIEIEIKKEKDLILIYVRDNGTGFNFEDIAQHNLGLQIVTSFVESKLNGMIVVDSDHSGTKTKIAFKNKIIQPD